MFALINYATISLSTSKAAMFVTAALKTTSGPSVSAPLTTQTVPGPSSGLAGANVVTVSSQGASNPPGAILAASPTV